MQDPPSIPSLYVQAGDVLGGKYLVDRVLGVGGMGAVVAARHMQLDEIVAIKFLLPTSAVSSEAVVRFEREARAAVKIKSEHVARVFDFGTTPGGLSYMVMEYLEGADLSVRLEQRGPLPIDEAVHFVVQACDAIAEAHALGIVHRDLKPSNLFVVRGSDGSERIKVLDFGISKLTRGPVSGVDMGITKTATAMGSPFYMSPEQMESSKNVDAATDVWSLGVILYEVVTGRVPFQGNTIPEVCVRIANRDPEPLSTYRPDAPARLERVIFKCMEKQRENRYRNVAELASALAEFGSTRAQLQAERIGKILRTAGVAESTLGPPIVLRRAPDARGTVGNWGQTHPAVSKGRSKVLGATGVILALAVGVYFLERGVAREAPPAPVVALSDAAPAIEATVQAAPAAAAEGPRVEVEAGAVAVSTGPVPQVKAKPVVPRAPSPPRSVFDRGRKW